MCPSNSGLARIPLITSRGSRNQTSYSVTIHSGGRPVSGSGLLYFKLKHSQGTLPSGTELICRRRSTWSCIGGGMLRWIRVAVQSSSKRSVFFFNSSASVKMKFASLNPMRDSKGNQSVVGNTSGDGGGMSEVINSPCSLHRWATGVRSLVSI